MCCSGRTGPTCHSFRNFPHSTPRDTAALFVDRVLAAWFQAPDQPCVLCGTNGAVTPVRPCGHLICTACFDGGDFSACPICHRRIDLDDPFLRPGRPRPRATGRVTPQRLRVLHLGRDVDTDAHAELAALLARPAALPPTDVADLTVLFGTRSRSDLSWLPGKVPGRETRARLLGWLMREPTHAVFTAAAGRVDTATDVLRMLVVYSGGHPSMINRPHFAPIPRSWRRHALSLLDRIELTQLVTDMRRNRQDWVRAGERLHPGEYADRYPTAFLAFASLRRTTLDAATATVPDGARIVGSHLRVATLGGRVEQAIAAGRAGDTAELLAARRPGDLVRRLDHLLRTCADATETARVLAALQAAVPHVAAAVLLAALGQLRTRAVVGSQRVFFPAGTASVAHLIPDTRPSLDAGTVRVVVGAITGELYRRTRQLPPVDVAVIDADLDTVVMPFTQRTAARALVALRRGTVLPLPTGRYVRLFCHWMQPSDQRVDLDLSVAFFDTAWNHVNTCDYTHLRVNGSAAVHSGDLTSAPPPLGASEFVDLDLDALTGVAQYAVVTVFSYNSIPFVDLLDAFAGWMLRTDPPGHGPLFDARTVEQRFDLAGPAKATLPLVIDLHARTARWLDVAPRVTGDNHAVHRHATTLATVAAAMIRTFDTGSRVTVGEVARIVAAGRTGTVLVRHGDTIDRYIRRADEQVAAFIDRLTRPDARDDHAKASATASAALQLIVRGDLDAPANADVYTLHAGQANAQTVRLHGFNDLLTALSPSP